jgi:cupin fold WbuC family metalloprotein
MKLEFEPAALRPIGEVQLDQVRGLAADAPRKRAVVLYHEPDEQLQRMLNAIEPGSYVRPHCHPHPEKVEVLLVLAGALRYCRWDEAGNLCESLELRAEGPIRGVEIESGVWHSMFALVPGTVFYEFSGGGWDPDTAKAMASWAPEESTPEGETFLHDLEARFA